MPLQLPTQAVSVQEEKSQKTLRFRKLIFLAP